MSDSLLMSLLYGSGIVVAAYGAGTVGSAFVEGYNQRRKELFEITRTSGRDVAIDDVKSYDGLYRNIIASDIPFSRKIGEISRLALADFVLLGTHLVESRFVRGKI